jgi:citrate synthase
MKSLKSVEGKPYFRSAISRIEPGFMGVRGYDLLDLIQHASWTEVMFLTLMNRRPSAAEVKVLDAIMIAAVDGGFMSAMAVAARYAASGGATVTAGVAAGIATAGYHTAAPQRIGQMLLEMTGDKAGPDDVTEADVETVVRRYLDRGERIPGLGHPVHKTWDPRTEGIRAVAEEQKMAGAYLRVMDIVEQVTNRVTGKTLPLNVDGAMGALLLDMGFQGEEMLAINILASATGVATHVIEEIRDGVPLRIVREHELEYTLPRETMPWVNGEESV